MTVVGWSRQRWVGHDGAPAPCCTSSGVLSLPLMLRPGRRTKIGTSHFGRSGHGPLSLGTGLEHLVACVGGAGPRAGRLLALCLPGRDRMHVVWGKVGSERVDQGGARYLKK